MNPDLLTTLSKLEQQAQKEIDAHIESHSVPDEGLYRVELTFQQLHEIRDELLKLMVENEKLREALEFYANQRCDDGAKARQALPEEVHP